MTLSEVLAKLEAMEDGAAMVETVKAETARLNAEAKKYREAKETAEASVKTLTDEKTELQSKLDATQNQSTGNNVEVETLKKQVATLQQQYDAAEKQRKEAEQQRISADITSQTVSALTKQNAVSPDEFAKLLTGSIKVADDGTYQYTRTDGTVGNITDCVTDWLKDKPWAVKNTQNPGSGGSNNAGGGSADGDEKAIEAAIMGY